MNHRIINNITECNGLGEYLIVFNGSAGIEEEGFFGISHLVEHCMCEEVKSIEPELQELALSWNAATSKNFVCFILTGLSENVKMMMNIFTKKILNYKITKEVFEREKKIVITERNMYLSNQGSEMLTNFYLKKYHSYEVNGKKEDLENITYEKFMEFKDKWFSTPSYIVMSHPASENDVTEDDLKESIGGIEFNSVEEFNKKYVYGTYDDIPLEDNAKYDNQRVIFVGKELMSSEKDNYMDKTYALILKNAFIAGLTSILYQEIREKLSCVYSISVNIHRLEKDKFYFIISTKTNTENVDTVITKLKEVLNNVSSYIDEARYKHIIKLLKSSLKLDSYIKYDYDLDDSVRIVQQNIINDNGELENGVDDFIKFVEKFDLKTADYFIDTDFKKN